MVRRKFLTIAMWVALGASVGAGAEQVASRVLVVASLNPIATDLVRQVGGDHVRVVELLKPGMNPHAYQPAPSDLRRASGATLYLAMGKGLETYLSRIQDALTDGQRIVELGRTLPSLTIRADDASLACCPHHAHGAIDPHWWHSVRQMKRAARVLAAVLSEADAPHRADYFGRYRRYAARLDALDRWVARELARIPRERRTLTTLHASLNYFCRDYGFVALPIKGLSSEEEVHPEHLAEVVDTIRAEGIKVVFPEAGSNQRFISALARETGVTIGGGLLVGTPDPKHPTYEDMVRSNVDTIVKAFAPEE